MIRRFVGLIFFTLVSFSLASAQVNIATESFLASERTPGSHALTHVLDGFGQMPIRGPVGAFASYWTQPSTFGEPSYGELYVGPSFQLTKTLQIGVGAGFEHVPGITGSRFAGYGSFASGNHNASFTFEWGRKSGRWYLGYYKYTLTKWGLSPGFRTEAFMGSGASLDIVKWHGFVPWIAILGEGIRDPGPNKRPNLNFLAGVSWSGAMSFKREK